ncbi:Transcription factor GTE8 [Platanthera guangdongensis]|uniref:Transcription factor GTE8 n=1 Tax=Platanthera guangdongensis TaxID=2320717 RepID=A0ABR2LGU5_9ASPA
MVTEKSSWSQCKTVKKRCGGDLSLTLMGKPQKSSRGYSSGFVSDERHAVEAVGESEGFVSQSHVGSDDSIIGKRRRISLSSSKSDDFFVPLQVFSLSKLTGSERKFLEMRLRQELDQVQKFQMKVLSTATMKSNAVLMPSSGDPLVKKRNCEAKQVSSSPSIVALMKQCETLLKRLMTHNYGWVFNNPVDVVKLNLPDYFTYIKQPMDLGTVRSKLASGAYSSPWDFASDVRLTFSNAIAYNPPGSDVYVMSGVMNGLFEMRWKFIEKKMAASNVAIKRETEVVKRKPETLKRKIPPEDHVIVVLDNEPKITDEEKLNLSRRLSLIPELPTYIVDFLKKHTSNADQDSDDEIEIDFDSLSVDTLLELKKLLDDCSQGNDLKQREKNEPCKMEVKFALSSVICSSVFVLLHFSSYLQTFIKSGLNNSMHPCKGNGPADVDDDLDICGAGPPISSYSPVDRTKSTMPRSCIGHTSSSSSSGSGSSSTDGENGTVEARAIRIRKRLFDWVHVSPPMAKTSSPKPSFSPPFFLPLKWIKMATFTGFLELRGLIIILGVDFGNCSDSDSGSNSRGKLNIEVPRSLKSTKKTLRSQGGNRQEKGPKVGADQAEQNAHRKAASVITNGSLEGENAPSERQVSPDKLYRAALLRSRFADTILKAREKTLDQGERRDPERLRQEREALERQQREERARLQAEAKAAEDARLKAEAEAAAEAKRRREQEREASRLALLQMEKTVEINENSLFLKDLEMLRTAPSDHIPGSTVDANLDCSNQAIDCFRLDGCNPLEQLGLFIKADDDEECDEDVGRSIVPANDVEEGEID